MRETKAKNKKKNRDKIPVKSYGATISSEAIEKSLNNTIVDAVTIEVANPVGSCDMFLAYLSIRYKKSDEWIELEKWKPVVVVGSWFNR